MFVDMSLLVNYSVWDPHKVASKSLLVGLEGPVILPSLKDRTGLSLMVSDYVAYEIMVRSHYVQIMAQTLPEQPESGKTSHGYRHHKLSQPQKYLCWKQQQEVPGRLANQSSGHF